MTPESKRAVKIIAIIAGAILIASVATILIVKKIQKDKAEAEALKAADAANSAAPKTTTTAPASSSGLPSSGSSTSSFEGRVFTKLEVEKMQSELIVIGTVFSKPDIVDAIRSTGGVDGVIGNGFKTAFNLAIQYGLLKDLDTLYLDATKV